MNAARVQWDTIPSDMQRNVISYCTYLKTTSEPIKIPEKVTLDTRWGPFELSEYNLTSIRDNLPTLLGI